MKLSELRALAAGKPEPTPEEVRATVRQFVDAMGAPARDAVRGFIETMNAPIRETLDRLKEGWQWRI